MALRPVVLKFIISGMPEVHKAVRSISETLANAERRSTLASRRESSERVRAAEREAVAKVQAWQRAERMVTAARMAGTRGAEAAFRAEVRALEQATSAKVRALQKVQAEEHKARAKTLAGKITEDGIKGLHGPARPEKLTADEKARANDLAAKEKVRAWLAADREEQKARDAAVRKHEAAERKKVREHERAERDKVRTTERSERQAWREVEKWSNQALHEKRREAREVERIRREKDRAVRRQAAEERREAEGREAARHEHRSSMVRGAFGSAMAGTIGVAQSAFHTMMGLGGGFSFEGAVQDEIRLRGEAASIVASSESDRTSGDVLNRARSVASAQGIEVSSVLRAYDEVKKMTGDLETALKVVPDLAKIATATGADVGELGGLAGNILAANPEEMAKHPEKLMEQVRLFTMQGLVGGVEIGDMAKYGGRLTAGAALFGGDKEKNEAVLGAMAQVARQRGGASSAAEAAMAAQRFATDVSGHAKQLKKRGIDVSDGAGKLKDPMQILTEMLDLTKGDITKFKETGLNDRGLKVLTGAADIYNAAGGGEKGKTAVLREFKKYSTAISQDEIERKNKQRLAELDMQLTRTMAELRTQVAAKLLPVVSTKLAPALVKLVPKIVDVTEHVARFATFLADNPFTGMGAIFAALFTKELASAGLAAVVEKAIATKIGGQAGLVLGTLTASIGAATLAVEYLSEKDKKATGRQVSATIGATNAQTELRRELLTPGGLAKTNKAALATKLDSAKLQASELQQSIAKKEEEKGGNEWAYRLAWTGGSMADLVDLMSGGTLGIGGTRKDVEETRKVREQQTEAEIRKQKAQLEQLNQTIAMVEASLKGLASAAGNAKPAIANADDARRGNAGPLGAPGRSGGT